MSRPRQRKAKQVMNRKMKRERKKAEKQLRNSLNAQNENSVIPNSSMTAKGGSSFSI